MSKHLFQVGESDGCRECGKPLDDAAHISIPAPTEENSEQLNRERANKLDLVAECLENGIIPLRTEIGYLRDAARALRCCTPCASESTFLTEVCEELFGCYLHTAWKEDGSAAFLCGICEKETDVTAWIHVGHNEGCIIPRVREYLAKHKPECPGHHHYVNATDSRADK